MQRSGCGRSTPRAVLELRSSCAGRSRPGRRAATRTRAGPSTAMTRRSITAVWGSAGIGQRLAAFDDAGASVIQRLRQISEPSS